MAAVSSQATLPTTELGVEDLGALYEALYPVRAKYRGFGLQIGVGLDEIKMNIEPSNKDFSNRLLEVLSSRLIRKPALTCNDIDKALRSRTVDEHTLADDFQSNFECKSKKTQIEIKKECIKKSRAAKSTKSESSLKMSKKGSRRLIESEERTQYYVESEDESKSNESENIQKAVKSAEVERQGHERDEPKSRKAKKRACKKERAAKYQCASEQPLSESASQLTMRKKQSERTGYVESEDESKSDESGKIETTVKSAEVERQVHEKDQPKSKRAKKRARKKEKYLFTNEQPVLESAIQLKKGSERIDNLEIGDESKRDENENAVKFAEVERQVHERDEPQSTRAKKRAHNREKAVRNQCASEQMNTKNMKGDK